MTDRPEKLNPPRTPLCPIYAALIANTVTSDGHNKIDRERMELAKQHYDSCPVCQARKAEFDELAKVAKEPEDANV